MRRAFAALFVAIGLAGPAAGAPVTQRHGVAETRRESVQQPVAFTVREHPTGVTIATSGYEVDVTREGFALAVRRGGQVVLQTAQASDATPNLGFTQGGVWHRVAALESVQATKTAVTLDYRTTAPGTVARVELRPLAGAVRTTAWLLESGGTASPWLRFRLAPSGLWYGGGFQGWRDPQVLPLNAARISKNAFFGEGNTQGTPVWFSTKGVGVWVRTPRDFRYTVNARVDGRDDGLLSLEVPGVSSVTVDLLVGTNVRDLVRRVVREVGYPRAVPPADYFRLPIYTTWVEHKTEVSQAKVLEFARAIRANNLPAGVVEIDDKWEAKYGDMRFDAAKFPDPKAMVDELHRMGFRVTLWVHPFVNTDSETFTSRRFDDLLLRDAGGNVGLIRWWQGNAAVWDMGNPRAAAELRSRLERLQKDYGFDGFKFDGGDVNLVPRDMRSASGITPFEYPDVYNREATAHFAWNETRVGIYSQPLGIVQRLIDKHSVWGRENGLAAIIPEAITVSMRGFPYVMPDMIGGNQYDADRIDAELLIRWAQASALMPLMQFSVGPWHHGEEVVRLAREASEVHVRFAPYIVRLAEAAPKTGEPILAPLWYHAPEDAETFAIVDQFMLGTDVVVAPVVTKGAVARDVYLPAGRWVDRKTGKVLDGASWIRGYPAPLDTLPLFVREGASVP